MTLSDTSGFVGSSPPFGLTTPGESTSRPARYLRFDAVGLDVSNPELAEAPYLCMPSSMALTRSRSTATTR